LVGMRASAGECMLSGSEAGWDGCVECTGHVKGPDRWGTCLESWLPGRSTRNTWGPILSMIACAQGCRGGAALNGSSIRMWEPVFTSRHACMLEAAWWFGVVMWFQVRCGSI
jgi:hypothetical protein